jgi:hypothetical protein
VSKKTEKEEEKLDLFGVDMLVHEKVRDRAISVRLMYQYVSVPYLSLL